MSAGDYNLSSYPSDNDIWLQSPPDLLPIFSNNSSFSGPTGNSNQLWQTGYALGNIPSHSEHSFYFEKLWKWINHIYWKLSLNDNTNVSKITTGFAFNAEDLPDPSTIDNILDKKVSNAIRNTSVGGVNPNFSLVDQDSWDGLGNNDRTLNKTVDRKVTEFNDNIVAPAIADAVDAIPVSIGGYHQLKLKVANTVSTSAAKMSAEYLQLKNGDVWSISDIINLTAVNSDGLIINAHAWKYFTDDPAKIGVATNVAPIESAASLYFFVLSKSDGADVKVIADTSAVGTNARQTYLDYYNLNSLSDVYFRYIGATVIIGGTGTRLCAPISSRDRDFFIAYNISSYDNADFNPPAYPMYEVSSLANGTNQTFNLTEEDLAPDISGTFKLQITFTGETLVGCFDDGDECSVFLDPGSETLGGDQHVNTGRADVGGNAVTVRNASGATQNYYISVNGWIDKGI